MAENIKKYFLYFIFYSVIGWLYEVFLEVVIYRWGFSNRGMLFGPYCIVYGFGALLLLFVLGKYRFKKIYIGKINIMPVFIFLGIIIITTVVELISSYIMEFITGGWLWDYRGYSFNFQGRIALNPSIRFGLGGMFFIYILQPLFEKFTARLSKNALDIISAVLFLIILTDIVFYIINRG